MFWFVSFKLIMNEVFENKFDLTFFDFLTKHIRHGRLYFFLNPYPKFLVAQNCIKRLNFLHTPQPELKLGNKHLFA